MIKKQGEVVELKSLTKKELMCKCRGYMVAIHKQQGLLASKQSQIRHFRNRLLKVRNSIDYLLSHPFSSDNGYVTLKHSRDRTRGRKKDD